jgi:hypothetical protein
MTVNRKYLIAGVAALAVAAGGVGVAQAIGGGDSEEGASGPAADKAKRAAVQAVGGGRAVEVEQEGGSWEVEVVQGDGRQVEVHLDGNLEPIGAASDDDAGGEDEGGAEDEGAEEREGNDDD